MNSDEEYLDDLLKSVMENEELSDEGTETGSESVEAMDIMDENGLADMMSSEELADLINSISDSDEMASLMENTDGDGEEADNELAIHDIGEEEADDELAIHDIGEEELDNELAIHDIGEEEADDELAIHDIGEEELDNELASHDSGEEESLEDLISDADIDAIFGAAETSVTDDVSNSEADMLAMLESMALDMENEEEEISNDSEKESDGKSKKVKKEKKSGPKLLGKKAKANQGENAEDTIEENESMESEAGAKKQNFFSKVVAFLVEADEDEESLSEDGLTPSDENKNILAELDEEDKKKKKKKVKGKKGKVEEASDGDNETEEGEAEKEEEDKKKKRQEKRQEKKEKRAAAKALKALEETKPKKKVSKKNVAVIVALCMTMTAMIVVLCSIVPGFFEKREAREAFYHSDYVKSYELLYGKKLDNSDTIIFNKSKIILELNRKLDAYHNYLAIGKEVQALDALMTGIQKYPEILLEAEEYHVTQEVDAIYETMLNIINDKYDISETMAKVIISYDDITYTRKLESIVNGTPFENPMAEEWNADEDLLSEEQDIVVHTKKQDVYDTVESQEKVLMENHTDTENSDMIDEADTEIDSVEEQLPISNEEDDEAVDDANDVQAQDAASDSANVSSDSQGQLIQGIQQPISVEIHGR